MLLEKVIPAVKSKWPAAKRKQPIIIQQDNAKPHCSVDDPLLVQATTENQRKISCRCQPPNSPDLNVLELGYFNSMQSLQHQKVPKTIDNLVSAVEELTTCFSVYKWRRQQLQAASYVEGKTPKRK